MRSEHSKWKKILIKLFAKLVGEPTAQVSKSVNIVAHLSEIKKPLQQKNTILTELELASESDLLKELGSRFRNFVCIGARDATVSEELEINKLIKVGTDDEENTIYMYRNQWYKGDPFYCIGLANQSIYDLSGMINESFPDPKDFDNSNCP